MSTKKRTDECPVCSLYKKLRARDKKSKEEKVNQIPNISYRIKARIVHEEYDGLNLLKTEQSKPVYLKYCPICGSKLIGTSFSMCGFGGHA